MSPEEALQALTDLPTVKSVVTVADVKEDDVVVIECDSILSQAEAERICQHVVEIWPNKGRKVLVLGRGTHLTIAKDLA